MSSRLYEQAMHWVRLYWQPATLGFLGFILLWQLVSLMGQWMELRQISAQIAQTETLSVVTPQDEEEGDATQPPQRDTLKNIFKLENAQYQLTAIFMEKAIINGQEVEVGGRVGKAEVKEINLFDVVIQEEGKENTQTLTMFVGGGGGGGRPSMSRGSRPGRPSRSDSNPGTQAPSRAAPSRPQQAPQGFDREAMMERFRNMSPEEREAARAQFRAQFGGRGGGGGNFGGRGGGGGRPPGGAGGGGRGGGGGRPPGGGGRGGQ